MGQRRVKVYEGVPRPLLFKRRIGLSNFSLWQFQISWSLCHFNQTLTLTLALALDLTLSLALLIFTLTGP